MKILILSLPRTRSSLLQDILSKHYNLENIFEPYKPAEFICHNVLFRKPTLINNKFVSAIKDISKNLEQKNNYVTKMFSMHTYNFWLYYHSTEKYHFDKNDIFDLENVHKISKYDTIYILKRKNLVDCIISFYFAYYRSEFIFTKKNKRMIDVYKPKNKIKLNIPINDLKAGVINYFVLEYQKKWLETNNYKIINLDYEEVPDYINKNFPNLESEHVETNYNYKQFILNYDEISETIKNITKELNLKVIS